MITIITAKKVINWNYKRLLKNLYPTIVLVYFILALIICGRMDGITLLK